MLKLQLLVFLSDLIQLGLKIILLLGQLSKFLVNTSLTSSDYRNCILLLFELLFQFLDFLGSNLDIASFVFDLSVHLKVDENASSEFLPLE